MSLLSDIQAASSNVQSAWTRNRAHVVAHLILALLIFAAGGADLPTLNVNQIDPKQITENEWYKLAKDTGIIFVAFALPIILLGIYLILVGTVSQVLCSFIVQLFPPPSSPSAFRLHDGYLLLPVALSLRRDEFNLFDLDMQVDALNTKYLRKPSEQLSGYQRAMREFDFDTQTYLGDFTILLIAWIVLFTVFEDASWVANNGRAFWPVLLWLALLVWFSWFRFSRALTSFRRRQLYSIYVEITTDPEMAFVRQATAARRAKVKGRIHDLLDQAAKGTPRAPSLLRFVRHRLRRRGKTRTTPEPLDSQTTPQWPEVARPPKLTSVRGRPFPAVYEHGYNFSRDQEQQSRFDDDWLSLYLAYVYFRAHRYVSRVTEGVARTARYYLTRDPS